MSVEPHILVLLLYEDVPTSELQAEALAVAEAIIAHLDR